ncbi:unnamed protein product [Didymodactylos carnosus]|uniref:Uncharacterized protein n=1 Tax=Didymodactylos carnosus TaxID=1234261 RepID=A0A815SSX3_9BILA|nr:unnamed protein product [Didymodactylos carnosus]CAF1492033.1 unnamed protein product [Didymodactylos carnosus]CAF3961530.1 unnamed protein product [Didymodactylos carnosus]CAF4355049.1 unnamed protein product [Didymodactylos carnosus]
MQRKLTRKWHRIYKTVRSPPNEARFLFEQRKLEEMIRDGKAHHMPVKPAATPELHHIQSMLRNKKSTNIPYLYIDG